MKYSVILFLLTAALTSGCAHVVHPGVIKSIESPEMNSVAVAAEEEAKKFGKEKVLVVYDLDNTLLAPNQDLGSDQWFGWQAEKISKGDSTAVASSIPELLGALSKIYFLGRMHAPEENAPAVFNDLAEQGFTTLILTSRGLPMRNASERELKANRYNSEIRALGGAGIAGTFVPYDTRAGMGSCFSQQEMERLKLGNSMPVGLVNGVLFTDGQHKGAMLRALLCRLHQDFSAIVFVDDTPKHGLRMHDAFDSTGLDLITIRYSREDPVVERFQKSDKKRVTESWNRLQKTLEAIFN